MVVDVVIVVVGVVASVAVVAVAAEDVLSGFINKFLTARSTVFYRPCSC